MDFFTSMRLSASGLSAQRLRMNLISGNLANLHTTRTAQGGPYRRKDAVFAAQPQGASFREILAAHQIPYESEVRVVEIVEDFDAVIKKFDPRHPDADEQGYVMLPDINLMEEMVNMISATRSYEANIAAMRAAKTMVMKALEIGA
jgi:flagellar basal-body rod protein FlgC